MSVTLTLLPRRRSAATVLALAVLLSGGSSTGKSAAPSPPEAAPLAVDEGADVSKMDTGPYAISPGAPFGTAGDDRIKQGMLEAQRLAAATVGPWEVKPQLVGRGVVDLNINATGRFVDADTMRRTGAFQDPLPDIAGRHGLIAAFSSLRVAPTENPKAKAKFWNLLTAVMRFPTAAAAAAAAADMAAAAPPPADASGPRREVALGAHRDALAAAYPLSDGREFLRAFTAEGPFVLYQGSAAIPGSLTQGTMFLNAESVVSEALSDQQARLRTFVPTPIDKLPDLPMDPSGFLMSRMLDNPSGSISSLIGAWTPAGWLHFEDDPIEAATWLRNAGVDWIAQRLSTVYRTKNADAAETLLKNIVDQMRGTAPAKPAGEVPGLPRARCFERDSAAIYDESAPSIQRVVWHFTCAAATDRYVFTVYAPSMTEAAQRISAQWRILAGK